MYFSDIKSPSGSGDALATLARLGHYNWELSFGSAVPSQILTGTVCPPGAWSQFLRGIALQIVICGHYDPPSL